MDRRRLIWLVFLTVIAVAATDVYVNGIDILDDFGRAFTVRIEPVAPGATSAAVRASFGCTACGALLHSPVSVPLYLCNRPPPHPSDAGRAFL